MDSVKYTFNLSQVTYQEAEYDIAAITAMPQRFYDASNIAWVMISSVLVFLMVPGLSLFYGGISDNRISLSMALLPYMTAAVIGIQWYLWGYAITFSNSPTSTAFWGGTDGLALHDSLLRPVTTPRSNLRGGPYIPEILYVLFEGMFASFTAALVSGASAWKDKPGHFLIFIVIWSTLVYDPIARWVWNAEGWSNQWGSMDFAGGSAVHVCAGATVLGHCIFHKNLLPGLEAWLGKYLERRPPHNVSRFPMNRVGNTSGTVPNLGGRVTPLDDLMRDKEVPSNYHNVLLGTILLWIGWFGFNGGSAMTASVRAVSACVSTHLSACFGSVTYCMITSVIEFYSPTGETSGSGSMEQSISQTPTIQGRRSFRFSIRDFCNGAVIGLVAITPAAGYVPHTIAPVFGIIPVIICWLCAPLSEAIGDSQSIVLIHGIGGFVGMILTGAFARGSVAALDGITDSSAYMGAWEGNRYQLVKQLGDALATAGYALTVTMIILVFLEPFMFLARQRQPRNIYGRPGQLRRVEDRHVLVEG